MELEWNCRKFQQVEVKELELERNYHQFQPVRVNGTGTVELQFLKGKRMELC